HMLNKSHNLVMYNKLTIQNPECNQLDYEKGHYRDLACDKCAHDDNRLIHVDDWLQQPTQQRRIHGSTVCQLLETCRVVTRPIRVLARGDRGSGGQISLVEVCGNQIGVQERLQERVPQIRDSDGNTGDCQEQAAESSVE